MQRTGLAPHRRSPHRPTARSAPVARIARTASLLSVLSFLSLLSLVSALVLALVVLASVVVAPGPAVTASAQAALRQPAPVPTVDPATLPRGPDPAIAHLVHRTIRDGDLRVRAPGGRATHESLWVVEGGYLVRDVDVGTHYRVRVRYVTPAGQRDLVTPSQRLVGVAVSADGAEVALQEDLGWTGVRTRVSVVRVATGQVLARRTFRLASLVAVTDRRVLLGRRTHWRDPATVWWTYRGETRHRVRRVHDQAAVRADLAHDRIVFSTSPPGEFCLRVAALSRPSRTLWRSCSSAPHQWSPDGAHVLLTHTYFDAAGTDTWSVADGRTGQVVASISGRLDWDAVWEDDSHFLTLAQSATGTAAVVRCDLTGVCERASRTWDVPVPADPSIYYAPPPVVLAE